jgi:Putative beta barrel porin-7 (BBP7)
MKTASRGRPENQRYAHVLCIAGGLLAGGAALGDAGAQPVADPSVPTSVAPEVTIPSASAPRLYGGIEYLYWWMKGAPLAVPLLSTAPFTEPDRGGFLKNSDATVLYGAPHAPAVGGNDTQSFPGFSGARLTVGSWLDDAHRFAIEGEGFLLQNGSAGYRAQSDANGSPGMRIPLYNSVPYSSGGVGMIVAPTEDGVPVSLPGELVGAASFTNTLQLWGLAANGVASLYRGSSWELAGLGGFRYLNLSEAFNLNVNINGLANTAFAGESGWTSDQFSTQNRFYGATLGLRGKYVIGPVSVELTGRVSFGVDNETLDVSGYFRDFNTPLVTSVPRVTNGLRVLTQGPNGIFAQPSNEGSSSGNRFAVVPEVAIKLGYNLTPSLLLAIGYNFLYESSVLRPTDQIDRNFSKGLPFQQDPTSTVGPTRRFKTTDFYAQGLTIGVSYRF